MSSPRNFGARITIRRGGPVDRSADPLHVRCDCPADRLSASLAMEGRMQGLNGSVGLGGRNRRSDVFVVQRALLEAAVSPGPIDGICGRRTIQAIERFQGDILRRPDGRIDVHGPSWRRLSRHANPSRTAAASAREDAYCARSASDRDAIGADPCAANGGRRPCAGRHAAGCRDCRGGAGRAGAARGRVLDDQNAAAGARLGQCRPVVPDERRAGRPVWGDAERTHVAERPARDER